MTIKRPPYLSERKNGFVLEPRGELKEKLGVATLRLQATTAPGAYAEAWSIISAAEEGKAPPQHLKQALTAWQNMQATTAPSTQRTQAAHCQFWLASLGDVNLQDITPQSIQKALATANKSENYKATMLATLKAFFNHLQEQGITDTNPSYAIKVKRPKPKPVALDASTITHLIATAEAMGYQGIADAIFLGCRIGLRRSDIIRLQPCHHQNGFITITQQKTKLEHSVPVKLPVEQRLTEIYKRMKSDHFITDLKGRPYSTALWDKHWQLIRDKAGLGDVKFKDLRSTFANGIYDNGGTKEALSAALGHSPDSTARVNYARTRPTAFGQFLPNL